MARGNATAKGPVDQAIVDKALAKAMADGDIVNFRQIFGPISPLRPASVEDVKGSKYRYLLPQGPEEENDPAFQDALRRAGAAEMQAFVKTQLESDGPAQLPSELLLPLADNALRRGKLASAAQAYELLRVRERMQEEFFRAGDTALDAGDAKAAARGYWIAANLAYDYATFPEPLPVTPNFHARALLLHAEYPTRPENCVPLQAPDDFLRTALGYLLLSETAAERLEGRGRENKIALAAALVRLRDPEWDAFAARYREACAMVKAFGERLQREANRQEQVEETLEDEIAAQDDEHDPRAIPAKLLGRDIPEGEWWQYLQEMAYRHPASALFVARQLVGQDLEILMPRYRTDAPLIQELGLAVDA